MPSRIAPADALQTYIHKLQDNLASGISSEDTHRSALEHLLESIDPTVRVFNDPKHISVGAPDFTVRRKGNATDFPVGWIETKNVGEDLDKAEKSEQLERYFGLPNLILTDYLEFRWFVDGKLRLKGQLATLVKGKRFRRDVEGERQVVAILTEFLSYSLAMLATPQELAERMARLAHLIREVLLQAFDREKETGHLKRQFEAFREILIPDLKAEQFADMYAQTIAYGLFAARCQPGASARTFSRASAADLIPRTNPFLRKLFQEIAFELEEGALPFVEDLVALLRIADIGKIMADFGKRIAREDPVVHFYEDFLKHYDPKVREMRGVYYTPEPVVSYIVRSVDSLLKIRFGKPMGLADKDVLILDPACGTGTFLYAVIQHIYAALVQAGQQGQWNSYVSENLLKRVFGFELLMAPYAVAHLKLGLLLQELGYAFESDERLGVYLTNTLEEAIRKSQQVFAFADAITREGEAAQRIKRDEKIMVVLGNPPYSGQSANRSWETLPDPKTKKLKKFPTFIGKLLQDYYFVDDKPLGEKNPKWLQDDYVKFLRFGQWRIDRTGYGILAFITNHGYLDNPTFRGMRQQLMRTFTDISILDLHGNTKKKETTPDGGKDENVFDIQQGVAIGMFAKVPKREADTEIVHSDLFGRRDAKYKVLSDGDVANTKWSLLKPTSPNYLFIRQSTGLLREYEQGYKLTDIFPLNSVGIVTARDDLAVRWTKKEVWETVRDFAALDEETARQKYDLGKDAQDWKVKWAQRDLRSSGPREDFINPVLYRPFDLRFTYYSGASRGFVCRPRSEVTRRMLSGKNIGLAWTRPMSPSYEFSVLVSRWPIDQCAIGNKTAGAGISYIGLVYPDSADSRLFDFEQASGSSLGTEFVKRVETTVGLSFVEQPSGDLKKTFGPEDMLHYIYAVLHSLKFRQRYAEFLKADIARVPLTADKALFSALAHRGQELVSLHLFEVPMLKFVTRFEQKGDQLIETVRFVAPNPTAGIESGRVYINASQFFEGVPNDLWEFQVGGYQVCEKWLKDRKGRKLSSEDIDHYQKIVATLSETTRLVQEVEALIPGWPLP